MKRSLAFCVLAVAVMGCTESRPGADAGSDASPVTDAADSAPAAPEAVAAADVPPAQSDLERLLAESRRVPNPTGWFEVIALPNQVYAFWEPGHGDRVNSFLITGTEKDVLYDTGLGIASIRTALDAVRDQEGHGQKPLMVVNSHNHLDHNGGNPEFDEAWIIEDVWAIAKLTEGVSGFADYWDQLQPHPGVTVPAEFDPQAFSVPPFPRERIRFLSDGDEIDLGNRQFRVIHTTAHSPDGLALYDAENRLFFGGDTFLGDAFLIRDLTLLAADLARVKDLAVDWHYSSHGPQLIEAMREGHRLAVVQRMLTGERTESTTRFAGTEFPLYELDGVAVTLAGDFLVY